MNNIARLRKFTQSMTDLVAAPATSENDLLHEGAILLKDLLEHDDWLPSEFAKSSQENYRQYLLHCDPLERFSVVSFVWEPGQKTPVHDHLTWGLVGQLRGEELCEEYVQSSAGALTRAGSHTMRCGEIDRVSPSVGDVHAVSNASDNVSVSIHVYGANIGKQQRHVFDSASGAPRSFVSGYHNAVLPNIWLYA